MAHRPLLTDGQQKELDMIRSMSYEEMTEWAKQFPAPEGKTAFDYAQYVDMTLEEFVETYGLIDITDRIINCGYIEDNDSGI